MESFKDLIKEYTDKIYDIMTLPLEYKEMGGYKKYPATRYTPEEVSSPEVDEALEDVEEIKGFYCNIFEEYSCTLEDTPYWELVEEFEEAFGKLKEYLYRTEWGY